MASTTTSAYSWKPAPSSSQGRSTATTSCPCASSWGVTRCQYHESDPAPWIKTNVAIVVQTTPTARTHRPLSAGADLVHTLQRPTNEEETHDEHDRRRCR